MTHQTAYAHLYTVLARVLVLGFWILLSASCTAGNMPVVTAATPASTSAGQPSSTEPPAFTPTPTVLPATATAEVPPAFTTVYVFDPEWDIEQVEFDFEPGILPTETITEFVQLSRLAYGELDTIDSALDVELVLKNTGDSPLVLDLDRRYFSFEDDQGRQAELIYFCCDAKGEVLAPGQTRSLHMIFRSAPGWEVKKEGAAEYIFFRVSGLGPAVRVSWRILPLGTGTAE